MEQCSTENTKWPKIDNVMRTVKSESRKHFINLQFGSWQRITSPMKRWDASKLKMSHL